MAEDETNNTLLNALALALVEYPRASLQELACAVGVSKATLYRFCRTRENLIERLIQRSIEAYQEAIRDANLDTAEPREGIRKLLENYYTNKELTIFIMQYWQPALSENCACIETQGILDKFFLRGQQEGCFRIDISAVAMTECCHGLFSTLIDAELRGRVPRIKVIDIIETMLLEGVCTQSYKAS